MLGHEDAVAAACELVAELMNDAHGYGDRASVTAIALVVRVHSAEIGERPATGQTLIKARVAGEDREEQRAYLVHMLEDAVGIARVPEVDPDDLPDWPS